MIRSCSTHVPVVLESRCRVITLLLTLLVAMFLPRLSRGMSLAPGGDDSWTHQDVHSEVFLGILNRLEVENTNGYIVVVGDPTADSITVDATKSTDFRSGKAKKLLHGLSVSIEEHGHILHVEPDYPEFNDQYCRVDFRITVPTYFSADVRTTNGSVTVSDIRDLKARVTNGAIHTERVAHSSVETTNGRVYSADGGEVHATTLNGTVTVDGARGAVTARTTNGSVDVNLSTVAGALTIGTTAGQVTLSIPRSTDANLDLRTDVGSITVAGQIAEDLGSGKHHLQLQLGTGEVPITATTEVGQIAIQLH